MLLIKHCHQRTTCGVWYKSSCYSKCQLVLRVWLITFPQLWKRVPTSKYSLTQKQADWPEGENVLHHFKSDEDLAQFITLWHLRGLIYILPCDYMSAYKQCMCVRINTDRLHGHMVYWNFMSCKICDKGRKSINWLEDNIHLQQEYQQRDWNRGKDTILVGLLSGLRENVLLL